MSLNSMTQHQGSINILIFWALKNIKRSSKLLRIYFNLSTCRPHPSMSPGQKTAAVVLTRGASTILIIFLLTTLVIFAVARIFDSSRMIHMNMEMALLFAHFLLLPSIHDKSEDACTLISIFIHFFFTACFVFMLLEAIHMYSLVAWVVRSDGLLSPLQNTVFGWTTAFTIGNVYYILQN